MKTFNKIVEKVCAAMNVFSAAGVFAMMSLIVVDVVLRKVFKSPIVGATEMVQLLIIVEIASVGMSAIAGRQVCVSALVEHFPPKLQLVVDCIVHVLIILVCIMTTYCQCVQVGYAYTKNTGYHFIGVPYWPFVALFAVSFFVTTIATILMLIRKINALVTGNYEGEVIIPEGKRLEMQAAANEGASGADLPEKKEEKQ